MDTVLEQARVAAAWLPRAERGVLRVRGPERSSWLNSVVTCDLTQVGEKGAAFGLLLNRTGKIQTDLWCLGAGDDLLMCVAEGTAASAFEQLDKMLVMEDAELEIATDAWAFGIVIGPEAPERARELAARRDGCSAALDLTGLGGAVLAVPRDRFADLLESGELPRLSAEQWQEVRLERLFPEFGPDYGNKDRPHEAALDRRAVSWSKGCYLGQEVVCMQDMRGKVKRSLVVLRAEAMFSELPSPGSSIDTVEEVEAEDDVRPSLPTGSVGRVTSAANSERLGKGLVMASLELAALSSPLQLTTPNGVVRLTPMREAS